MPFRIVVAPGKSLFSFSLPCQVNDHPPVACLRSFAASPNTSILLDGFKGNILSLFFSKTNDSRTAFLAIFR